MNHSQRLSESPLAPWVAVRQCGTIVTAHCNCKAGLSAVCSHVGALLFAVEANIRLEEKQTCTSVPCQFILPKPIKNVPQQELVNINFTSSKSKKRALDNAIETITSTGPKASKSEKVKESNTSQADENEMNSLFEKLHSSGVGNAILSIIPHYNASFREVEVTLPCKFDKLYSEDLKELSIDELLKQSAEFCESLKLSADEVLTIERCTRDQINSNNWKKMRFGRITASKVFQITRTSVSRPAMSLLKDICYGSNYSSNALDWGIKMEKKALQKYEQVCCWLLP